MSKLSIGPMQKQNWDASIALCLAGKERTLLRAWDNIYAAMIRPIAPQVAVFAAVQINTTRLATVNATILLLTKVAVSTVFRKQRDALIGLTSHTPCYLYTQNVT